MRLRAVNGKRKASAAVLSGLIVAGLLAPSAALPHAAIVEAAPVAAVIVTALYDTGEPMREAQIIVFAPEDPNQPAFRGVADQEGRFIFVPDPPAPGRWTIQARTAGHGAMAHVTLQDTTTPADRPAILTAAAPTDGPGPLQRWIMAGCVIWGFVGTALYFRRRPA